MLKRLYVNNFQCLQNFEFNIKDLHSVLLLGKNGTGKTTIFEVVEIFQKIGQGITSLQNFFPDVNFGNINLPMELEIDVEIRGERFNYRLIVEFPERFLAPKINKEELTVEGTPIFDRDGGQTSLNEKAHFVLDWHHIGLPLLSVSSNDHPINIFREWLRNIIILSPIPRHFYGLSKNESTTLLRDGENVIDWARWLLSLNPSLYVVIFDFLKNRMSDIATFKFKEIGQHDRRLIFTFQDGSSIKELDFEQFSDGEKVLFLAAAVMAAQKNNPYITCLWDEPDNFISLVELNHFITEYRKAFEASSSQTQLIVTSHNSRVINNFSNHNIFVVSRLSHLSPTRIKLLEDIHYDSQTVIDAYDNGELDNI